MESADAIEITIARHCLAPALRRRIDRDSLARLARHCRPEARWAEGLRAPACLTRRPWFAAACIVAHRAGIPVADIEAFAATLRTRTCAGRDVSPAMRFADYTRTRMPGDPAVVRQATLSRALAAFSAGQHRCSIRRSRQLPWRWLVLTDTDQLDLFLDTHPTQEKDIK